MVRRLPWRKLFVDAVCIVAAAAAAVAIADGAWLVFAHEHQVPDFRVYFFAAEAVLRGDSPYPAPTAEALTGSSYVYPPFLAILFVPLTALPVAVAEGLVVLGGAAIVVATLLLLDVRDWRCYGIALLWVAVLNAIGLGNVTIFLVLSTALAWRLRDRPTGVGLVLGASLAAKLFLWPLLPWLAATRRLFAVLLGTAVWLAFIGVSWAVIGFAGLVDYHDLLRVAHSFWADEAYSVYALGLDAGLSDRAAASLGFCVSAALLAGSIIVGRRGNDRASFILAIAAALAFSPIVWRHYFALLLVVVAVARPRLGLVWFVPLLMWPISEGIGNGTSFETAATLTVAAMTIGLALWSVRSSVDRRQVDVRADVVPVVP